MAKRLQNNNVKFLKQKNWRALKQTCLAPERLEIQLLERSYQKKSLKIWLKQTKKEVRWAIKIKKNKEWYKIIIKFTLPSSTLKQLSIEYANDLYRGISAKNCSREERGQSETWVRLESLEQKLLPNKEWLPFFVTSEISNIPLVYS